MNNDFITFVPMQTMLFGDITVNFQVLDASGFPGALAYIHFLNTMDVDIIYSFDGIYNHGFIFSGTQLERNLQLGSSPTNQKSLLKNKTKVWIKQVPGLVKSGRVVVSGFY